MTKTRSERRRRSPATAISLVALVIAMSGTAYAATGGTFILGRANKATTVTSLTNSKGTALALSSGNGRPPMRVNSSVEVPNLNASYLSGLPATDFMRGNYQAGVLAVGTEPSFPLAGSGVDVHFGCSSNGLTPVATISISALLPVEVWWLDKDGSDYRALTTGQSVVLAQTSLNPYTVVVQASAGLNVGTADLSMAVHLSAENCSFAYQSTSGGIVAPPASRPAR